MKSGRFNRLGRRVLSVALAAAAILSLVVLEPPKAKALRVRPDQNMTTSTGDSSSGNDSGGGTSGAESSGSGGRAKG